MVTIFSAASWLPRSVAAVRQRRARPGPRQAAWRRFVWVGPLARWRVHASSWTFRHPELFRSETMLMLERYRALYPDFAADYAQEIATLMDVVDLSEARDAWLKGDKRPIVRLFLSQPSLKRRLLAIAILFWPVARAAQALRMSGYILPDELVRGS